MSLLRVDPCTPTGHFRVCPDTSVGSALDEARRLIESIQYLFSDLDGEPLEPGAHYGIEFLARCAAELVDSARRGVVRHEGGGIRMNLGHVIRKKYKSDAAEVLNADQIDEIKHDLDTARDAICNISLGVAAIGELLANTAMAGEIGQDTAERLGWLLGELGGGIYGLMNFETACTERLRAQGGRGE